MCCSCSLEKAERRSGRWGGAAFSESEDAKKGGMGVPISGAGRPRGVPRDGG